MARDNTKGKRYKEYLKTYKAWDKRSDEVRGLYPRPWSRRDQDKELSELSKKLYTFREFGWSNWMRNAPKHYTQMLNRQDRRHNKMVAHNLTQFGSSKKEFRYQHRHSGKWYW